MLDFYKVFVYMMKLEIYKSAQREIAFENCQNNT